MKWDVRSTTAAVLASCLCAALFIWTIWPAEKPEPGVMKPITQAAKEERAAGPRRAISPKKVMAVPDSVKPDLGLPHGVQDDPGQSVLATAKLDAEERPYTLAAVLDQDTGNTTIHVREDPLPWFGLESVGAISIHAGYRADGRQVIRLGARYDMVRVKAFHAGLAGSFDSDGQSFVGIGAEWRFR